MLRRAPLIALLLASLTAPAGAAVVKGDRDKDGMPDKWEQRFKLKSAVADADRDGLGNRAEFQCGTHPRKRDSDRDRLVDAKEDADRDGLGNKDELRFKTNCRKADSDGDGVKDGPQHLKPTIKNGRLTVVLPNGKVVAGKITGDTIVRCDDEDTAGAAGAADEPEAGEGDVVVDGDVPPTCREQLEAGAQVLTGKVVNGLWTVIQLVSSADDDDAILESEEGESDAPGEENTDAEIDAALAEILAGIGAGTITVPAP